MSERPPAIDTSRAHPARVYDYFLGGKNHFAADRAAADQVPASLPSSRTFARENRASSAARSATWRARPASGSLDAASQAYRGAGLRGQARDLDEFARLVFAGLELVPPGVVR